MRNVCSKKLHILSIYITVDLDYTCVYFSIYCDYLGKNGRYESRVAQWKRIKILGNPISKAATEATVFSKGVGENAK